MGAGRRSGLGQRLAVAQRRSNRGGRTGAGAQPHSLDHLGDPGLSHARGQFGIGASDLQRGQPPCAPLRRTAYPCQNQPEARADRTAPPLPRRPPATRPRRVAGSTNCRNAQWRRPARSPVARLQPAVFASAFVNGKAHPVPLAVSNRGERLDQRTDRNRNVRRAPVDGDYGFVSCVQ